MPLSTAQTLDPAGVFERLEDLDRLAHIHRAIEFVKRRVAQLANTDLAGADVAPAMRTFLGEFLGDLVKLSRKFGVESLEQGTEMGRHGAAANENDVGIFDELGQCAYSFNANFRRT